MTPIEDPKLGVASSGRSVLLVDDDPLMLNIIQLALNDLDLEIAVCMDGLEALDFLKSNMPNLIICENTVPKIDGLSLVRNLIEDHPSNKIPTILLSHRKDFDLVEQATALGIAHILQKPLYPAELNAITKHLLSP